MASGYAHGLDADGFVRTVHKLNVTEQMTFPSNIELRMGNGDQLDMAWETADADAAYLRQSLPAGGAVDVPVLAIGTGLDGVDLGMFNGLTEPMAAIIDADRDSYIGLTFSSDDVAIIKMRLGAAGTVRNHTVPDVASDTFEMLAAAQTVSGAKTYSANLTLNDDVLLGLGTGATARFSWDTTDANANALLLQMPAGGAVDVPVLAIGQSIESVDLGLYNGIVNPLLAFFGIGAVTTSPIIEFRKGRGTIAAPTAVTTGDDLGIIRAYAAVAAGEWIEAVRVTLDSMGTIATTRGPGRFAVAVATDAAPSVMTERIEVTASGLITLTPGTDVVVADGTGLIVGATAQVAVAGLNPELQEHGTAAADSTAFLARWSADTSGPVLYLAKSRSTTIGTFGIITTGDVLGGIEAFGDDGVDFNSNSNGSAAIRFVSTGTIAADRVPGEIQFLTATNAAPSVLTLALTLTSGQNATFAGDVAVNGGDLTSTATTFNLLNATVTTLNLGGAATTLAVGAAASATTWTGQSFTVTGANTTNNTALTVQNTTNTAVAAHAIVDIAVGGTTSTGDPQLRLTIPSGTSWYVGADNSNNDVFTIGSGTDVGTTPYIDIDPRNTGGIERVRILSPNTTGTGATAYLILLDVTSATLTLTNTTQVNTSAGLLRVRALTIAQSGGAVTVDYSMGIESVGPTAGASVTLTHSSAYRARTGGAAVNASGFYFEAQTAGTTSNPQAIFAVSSGAIAAITDHVQLNARDFAGGDARLYVQGEAGSAVILGNNSVRVGIAGTATGTLVVSGATSGVVTMTVAAAAGTWTMTLPTGVAGTAGFQLTDAGADGVTSWSGAGSLLAFKELLPQDKWLRPEDALDRVLGTRVVAFRYRPGMGTQDPDTRYDGPVADPDWPGSAPWAMHYGGRILNPVNAFGHTILAIQALHQGQDSLEKRVDRLEAELAAAKAELAARRE